MSGSRNQFVVLAGICIVGVILYVANGRNEGERGAKSHPQSVVDPENSDTNPKEFAGYECTLDCSGHEAGYKWAEEHNISDGEACDMAGEHSNSPSFAEGCHAYVDGESSSEEAADADAEN